MVSAAANAMAAAGRDIGRFAREGTDFFLLDFLFARLRTTFFVVFRDEVRFVVLVLAFRERFFFLGMNCPLNAERKVPLFSFGAM